MSKNTLKAIGLFVLLVMGLGFGGALGFIWQIISKIFEALVVFNKVFYDSLGESLLSGVFKHYLTYRIVGLILSAGIAGGSAFLGKWIGKLAYLLVAIGIVAMFNFISILIA